MSGKVEDIEYIHVSGYSNALVIRVDDVNEFLKLVDKFRPTHLLLNRKRYGGSSGDRTESEIRDAPGYDRDHGEVVLTEFVLLNEGALYLLLGWNYSSVSDMIKGRSLGFKYGDTYYEAMNGGFTDYADYKQAKDLGYQNKADYIDSGNRGFRECYGKFAQLKFISYSRSGYPSRGDDYYALENLKHELRSEGQVYYCANRLGYQDYEKFQNGVSRGYQSADQYREGDFGGFVNFYEYQEAKAEGIATKEHYDTYLELQEVKRKYGLEQMEEAHVLSILLNPEIGRNVPVSKLWKWLQDGRMKLKIDEKSIEKSTEWYTRKFKGPNDLRTFVSGSKGITRIGEYNKVDDIITVTLPDRKAYEIAVVDGSNVAWNGGSRDKGDRPSARNLRIMVDTLKTRGFEKILVIADASLYAVDDKEILNELEKEALLKKAPSKEQADRFIIEYAKERDPLIITNDTFKDWKEKDPWVNKNIDEHLVKFMILDNVATFGEYKYNRKIDERLRGKNAETTTYDDDDWDD